MDDLPDEIPVDEFVTRYDPGGAEESSSAFSLASTLHDFSYENGRRYPSYRSPQHPFPQDDLTVKNERILHHLMLFLLGNKLCLAPVEDPKHVLDVKCAQGLWAENAAERWEDAEIVAMDTTPRERSTYPNCEFIVQALHEEWVFDQPDLKFDFVYVRNIFANLNDFQQFYRQCYEYSSNMLPGGYLEHTEVEINARCDDGSARPDSTILELTRLVPQLSSAFDTEFNIAPKMKDRAEMAGFVDIVETRYKLPLGPWSKDPVYKQTGEWFEAFYKSGLQGWMLAIMTRKMGYTPEQVNELCEQAFQEVDDRDQHYYFTTIVMHARKPS